MPAIVTLFLRPYLHIYSQSNEVEDLDIISLEGSKIEFDAATDALFGVSSCFNISRAKRFTNLSETLCIHNLYTSQLVCTASTHGKGPAGVGEQIRPHQIANIQPDFTSL